MGVLLTDFSDETLENLPGLVARQDATFGLLVAFTAEVYYLEGLNECSLYVSYPERAMAYVIRRVEGVKNYEWVCKRALLWVVAELYLVAIEVEQVGLEAYAVEVEKAGEVGAKRLLFLAVKPLQVGGNHEDKTVRADASVVRHAQESAVEDLLDYHDDRTQILPLANQVLDVVNCVYTTVCTRRLEPSVKPLEVIAAFIDADVDLQVAHLRIYLLGIQTPLSEVDGLVL